MTPDPEIAAAERELNRRTWLAAGFCVLATTALIVVLLMIGK